MKGIRPKGNVLYDFSYMTFCKRQTIGTENMSIIARHGCGEELTIKKQRKKILGNDGIILYSIVVIDTWFNALIKPTGLYTSKSKFHVFKFLKQVNQIDRAKGRPSIKCRL